MRRWARAVHGLDVLHYAISIVRGRGIDHVALQHLAEHHDTAEIVFVDGWTGKGAIVRELTASIEQANARLGTAFRADLAVLADPGSCVTAFGTRDDFLIPSACLNSTVSGLVSRTVLNRDLLGSGDFHGAKFYSHLAASDAVEPIRRRRRGRVPRRPRGRAGAAADVAGRGRRADLGGLGERGGAERAGGDRRCEPGEAGVGETTRVLLRRVPWKVLVRDANDPALAHLRMLAARRGTRWSRCRAWSTAPSA